MKQKRIYLGIIFLAFVFFVLPSSSLAEGVCFKPEFPIPGFELDGAKDGCPGGKILSSKGDAIIVYINALYKYGAGLAGLMAMFMIVFAAWQWIMASGNAGKIDNAKDTIRGALLGLTLLFAGNLLLSNITTRLVSFNGLNINNITTQQFIGCRAIEEASKCVGACEWKYVRGVSESNSSWQCVDRVNATAVRTCEEAALNHDCNTNFNIRLEGADVVCKGLRCEGNERCSYISESDVSGIPVLCQTNSTENCQCRLSASLN